MGTFICVKYNLINLCSYGKLQKAQFGAIYSEGKFIGSWFWNLGSPQLSSWSLRDLTVLLYHHGPKGQRDKRKAK